MSVLRRLFVGMAALGVMTTFGASSGLAAGATAYECVQFTNPTVNHVWTAICYAPCGKYHCG
jgi:hypothetical protein